MSATPLDPAIPFIKAYYGKSSAIDAAVCFIESYVKYLEEGVGIGVILAVDLALAAEKDASPNAWEAAVATARLHGLNSLAKELETWAKCTQVLAASSLSPNTEGIQGALSASGYFECKAIAKTCEELFFVDSTFPWFLPKFLSGSLVRWNASLSEQSSALRSFLNEQKDHPREGRAFTDNRFVVHARVAQRLLRKEPCFLSYLGGKSYHRDSVLMSIVFAERLVEAALEIEPYIRAALVAPKPDELYDGLQAILTKLENLPSEHKLYQSYTSSLLTPQATTRAFDLAFAYENFIGGQGIEAPRVCIEKIDRTHLSICSTHASSALADLQTIELTSIIAQRRFLKDASVFLRAQLFEIEPRTYSGMVTSDHGAHLFEISADPRRDIGAPSESAKSHKKLN